jgi:autotransporter-associated beta strand protein
MNKSYVNRHSVKALAVLTAGVSLAHFSALGVDRSWSGGTASYTNAGNWTGGVVPGSADTAINNNGSNNVVQINAGNPDWTVGAILAGAAGSGAFQQGGQTVSVQPGVRTIRLGTAPTDTGIYTLNDGTLFYTNGMFAVGEIGTGILNVNGGILTGNGTLAINAGDSMATASATMDGGFEKTGHTWFGQGFYTPDPSIGLPTPGSTFVAVSNSTHSYTMAASYTANNSVMVYSNATSTTITLSSPAAFSQLSFLGSAGNAPGGMVIGYTVHHADATTESGNISIQDWFPANKSNLALETRGRVQANGTVTQIIANNPSILFHDVTLTNTSSPVTSVDLTYISGDGVACILAVSASSGGDFNPVTFTGYNADMIVEPVTLVDPSITDVLNQTGGTIGVNAEMWIGNGGNGIYNLSGGSNTVGNWFAVGRSGGDGIINMSGGVLNKVGGGNFLIGTGYQSPIGGTPSGEINLSGGTINCSSGEFLVPENSPSAGTLNMSGSGTLMVNNWLAIGRNGGAGVLNLTNGVITKTGGGNIVVGAGGQGTINQFGGVISNTGSATWLGEASFATWNMNGGSAVLGLLRIAEGNGQQSTLTMNGGEITASEISGNPNSLNRLNLNGGTIRTSGNNGNFMHDLSEVNLQAGGVVFDSKAFGITIPVNFVDQGGGITKIGTGTLNLSGNTEHSGPTVINEGRLEITTVSSASDFSMADNTQLGVTASALNDQIPVSGGMRIGSAGVAVIDFNMGLFGINTQAPIGVTGELTNNAALTINIPSGAFTTGVTIPLISYNSYSGAGTFLTGVLPTGVAGYVTNNTTTKVVGLVVTSAAAPRWDGTVDGNWNINTTSNWVDIATGNPAVFQNGNPVVFNDQAIGTTDINVAQNVSVSGMIFTNDTLAYKLTGPGRIGGTTGLTKQGASSVTIGNTNTFTGVTTVQGGSLVVSNLANGGLPSAIGASSSSAANLVIGAGTFSYAGPTVAVDRGFTIQSSNSTINASGNLSLSGPVTAAAGGRFLKTGLGLLTYAGGGSNAISGTVSPGLHVVEGPMLFNGPLAGQTNRVQGDMYVGGVPNVAASLTLSNSTLLLNNWLGVGRGNGNSGTTSSLALHNSTLSCSGISFGWWNNLAGNSAVQNITLTGTSTITNRGGADSNISESGGSTTTVNILDNSVFGTQNRLTIASGGEAGAGTGTVMVAQSGKLLVNSFMSVGNGNGRVGYLTVKDNGTVFVASDFNVTDTGSSKGTLTIQDAAFASGGAVFIGKSGGSTGVVNMSSGTLMARTGDFQVGATGSGTFNQTGGTVIATNWMSLGRNGGGVGVYNLSGGSLIKVSSANRFNVGEGGTGTLNVSGSGAVVMGAAIMDIGRAAGPAGTVNLNGGSITVNQVVRSGSSVGTFNFNGGTLIAGNAANANFMNGLSAANVQAGGAVIDSGTNVINIGQALLDGGGNGGLTKIGNGTLNLNGVNTYTGSTLVSTGALGGTGTIAGSVTVASTGTLAPGVSVGTLTIGGDLNLGGNMLVQLSTNGTDLVSVTGGVTNTGTGTVNVSNLGTNISAGNVFTLVNKAMVNGNLLTVTGGGVTWSNRLAIDGTIVALTGMVSTTPVPIVSSVAGGSLNLSWPSDHTGWRLEVQTNLLSQGLSTNWSTWPGSQATNAVSIPISPANPSVFFRLTYP